MNDEEGHSPETPEDPPQLQFWDANARETAVGNLVDEGEVWQVFVAVERTAPDLCRGRLSFRQDGERFDTGPVILEETEAAVVSRAAELPPSALKQFLDAVRD